MKHALVGSVLFVFFLTAPGVAQLEITGTVSANATPGALPDGVGNAAVVVPLSGVRVQVVGGPQAVTAADGTYVLTVPDAMPRTIEVELVGPFAQVLTAQGAAVRGAQVVMAPATADFLLNAAPDEYSTAQVNVFCHVTMAHDFFRSRAPLFGGLDFPVVSTANIALSCGATFNSGDLSLGFFHAASGCVNTGYSSVVLHEYGHVIVNRFGLAQGAFGEGYADALSLLALDDPVVGRDFLGPGISIRQPGIDAVQYPCAGSVFFCGQVLAGAWYRISENLQTSLGDAAGLEHARQLFVDWSQITLGGQGSDAAHPDTVIEVLTVDDDDGDLSNGTPHFTEICAAFAAHGIPCPEPPGLLLTHDPLVRGLESELVVTGAVPGTLVAIVAGTRGVGAGRCYPQLGGLCLGFLGNPRLVGSGTADANGELRLTLRVPASAPLIEVVLQAANRVGPGGADSMVSEVVVSTVGE
jgi:hypothetical protein